MAAEVQAITVDKNTRHDTSLALILIKRQYVASSMSGRNRRPLAKWLEEREVR